MGNHTLRKLKNQLIIEELIQIINYQKRILCADLNNNMEVILHTKDITEVETCSTMTFHNELFEELIDKSQFTYIDEIEHPYEMQPITFLINDYFDIKECLSSLLNLEVINGKLTLSMSQNITGQSLSNNDFNCLIELKIKM